MEKFFFNQNQITKAMNFITPSVMRIFGAKFWKNKMVLTVLFLLTFFTSFAQKEIKGTIKDVNGAPLPGVTIMEKNTTGSVLSDFDGKFKIVLKNQDSKLIFTYIGFKTQEITILNQTNLDVILSEANEELSEVVVVGYGTQKKSRVTTAIASIKEKDFIKGNIRDAADLIKGKVAGLTISNGSGDPGSSSNITFFKKYSVDNEIIIKKNTILVLENIRITLPAS